MLRRWLLLLAAPLLARADDKPYGDGARVKKVVMSMGEPVAW